MTNNYLMNSVKNRITTYLITGYAAMMIGLGGLEIYTLTNKNLTPEQHNNAQENLFFFSSGAFLTSSGLVATEYIKTKNKKKNTINNP